jgi:hypothetical protein
VIRHQIALTKSPVVLCFPPWFGSTRWLSECESQAEMRRLPSSWHSWNPQAEIAARIFCKLDEAKVVYE